MAYDLLCLRSSFFIASFLLSFKDFCFRFLPDVVGEFTKNPLARVIDCDRLTGLTLLILGKLARAPKPDMERSNSSICLPRDGGGLLLRRLRIVKRWMDGLSCFVVIKI